MTANRALPQSERGLPLPLTWKMVVALAAAAALAGGLLELGGFIAGQHLVRRPMLYNPRMIGFAPLANLFVSLPVIGAMAVGLRRWRPAIAFPVALGAVVAIALLPSALHNRWRIHPAALVVLCAGAGSVVTRMARARPRLAWSLTRVTTTIMLLISVCGSVLLHVSRRRAEASRMDALAAAAAGAPNVLLLVLDTVRGMSLSVNGYARRTTPRLEALARDGVRFSRAVSAAPWTLPSHASIFTGHYPHDLTANYLQPLDDAQPVLSEVFDSLGYLTGGFAANLTFCTNAHGLTRGFQTWRDYLTSPGEVIRSSNLTRTVAEDILAPMTGSGYLAGRPEARDVIDEFLDWQTRVASRGRPFFAFLNVFDAHGPYAPPAPYDTLYLGRQPRMRDPEAIGHQYTDADVSDLRDAYEATITWLDAEIGRLFDQLRQRGVLDNTIVIVTADHGEEFEHGLLSHGDGLYFPSLFVPLIIRYPAEVPANVTVDTPVSLRDLAATILDLARTPTSRRLPGVSLAARWTDSATATPVSSPILSELRYARNHPADHPVARGDMQSLVQDGLHLIRRGDGEEELYDIVHDPFEAVDLAGRPEEAPAMNRLRATLQGLVPPAPGRR